MFQDDNIYPIILLLSEVTSAQLQPVLSNSKTFLSPLINITVSNRKNSNEYTTNRY